MTGDNLYYAHYTERGEVKAQAYAIAFHEEAGRSQVDSCLMVGHVFSSPCRVATVAMLPSALCVSDHSLVACWAFSVQPALRRGGRRFVPEAYRSQGMKDVARVHVPPGEHLNDFCKWCTNSKV